MIEILTYKDSEIEVELQYIWHIKCNIHCIRHKDR